MNPYQLLGVEPGADALRIRRAFRNFVSEHHPDRGGDAARFREGVEAYSRLRAEPVRVPGTLTTHHRPRGLARILRRRASRTRIRRVV